MDRKHLEREKLTIGKMIAIYCRGKHHSSSHLCSGCETALHAVTEQIEMCPYNSQTKPACGLCRTNCFTPEMRRLFRDVMRFSGPRMLVRHPLLTVAHFVDAVRAKLLLG